MVYRSQSTNTHFFIEELLLLLLLNGRTVSNALGNYTFVSSVGMSVID